MINTSRVATTKRLTSFPIAIVGALHYFDILFTNPVIHLNNLTDFNFVIIYLNIYVIVQIIHTRFFATFCVYIIMAFTQSFVWKLTLLIQEDLTLDFSSEKAYDNLYASVSNFAIVLPVHFVMFQFHVSYIFLHILQFFLRWIEFTLHRIRNRRIYLNLNW